MRLIDKATGKVIAYISDNRGMFLDEAIELADMEQIIIDPSTMEKGYRDSDGDEHYYEDLAYVENDEEE